VVEVVVHAQPGQERVEDQLDLRREQQMELSFFEQLTLTEQKWLGANRLPKTQPVLQIQPEQAVPQKGHFEVESIP
jgi:hypothetical protein